MTTLEEFYYGNIIPHEIPILTATLTEQQKPFLEQDEMVEITGLEEM